MRLDYGFLGWIFVAIRSIVIVTTLNMWFTSNIRSLVSFWQKNYSVWFGKRSRFLLKYIRVVALRILPALLTKSCVCLTHSSTPTSINPNTHQPQHPLTATSINPKINQFQHPSTLTSINPNIHQPPNSPFYFLTWHSVCMLFFSHLWKGWNYIINIFSTEEIYTPYLFLILFLTPSHTLNNLIQSLT